MNLTKLYTKMRFAKYHMYEWIHLIANTFAHYSVLCELNSTEISHFWNTICDKATGANCLKIGKYPTT